MPIYSRNKVPLKGFVTLKAIFSDINGDPVDVDDINEVDVVTYSPDDWASFEDLDNEIEDQFPSATNDLIADSPENPGGPPFDPGPQWGSGRVKRIAKGYYEVEYNLPDENADPEKDVGTWVDIWSAVVGGTRVTQAFTFTVVEKGTIKTQKIKNNTLIGIILSEDIAGLNGQKLGVEKQFTFSTKYDPYYASVDLLRLECGGWLDGIPDDTLSLMIHWSSIEADAWSAGASRGKIFDTALTKFVVYDSAVRCLLLPADTGGKKKALGDLLIETSSDFSNVISEVKRERDEWLRVVNAGGTIVPGQGLAPAIARKGSALAGKNLGRMWHSPLNFAYAQPTQNAKFSAKKGGKKKYGWGKD